MLVDRDITLKAELGNPSTTYNTVPSWFGLMSAKQLLWVACELIDHKDEDCHF